MPRKRPPFIRLSAVRDARLIIIATEDTKAAVAYFEGLVSTKYFQNPRVHVEVLQRQTTASAPGHILRQLDEWRETMISVPGMNFGWSWMWIDGVSRN